MSRPILRARVAEHDLKALGTARAGRYRMAAVVQWIQRASIPALGVKSMPRSIAAQARAFSRA